MRWFLLVLLVLAACGTKAPTGSVIAIDKLVVNVSDVQAERIAFAKDLRAMGTNPDKRALYEKYIDVIGANGILDGIEQVYSECHTQAHDLGKVVFERVQDIGAALSVCQERCYSGCMHGVLMEAFKDEHLDDGEGHLDIVKLKGQLQDLCFNNKGMAEYGPGECAHGTGHALMFLSGYNIQSAIDGCNGFEKPAMKYYCADGAYMEFLTAHSDWTQNESLFYPCDSFSYPGGCMRTKVGMVGNKMIKAGGSLNSIIAACKTLNGTIQFACFHGLGTAYSRQIEEGKVGVRDVCGQDTQENEQACVEGALEFMGKYWPKKVSWACQNYQGDMHERCVAAGKRGLYGLDKDLTQYLAGAAQ